MAEKAGWDQANRRQKFGLVLRNRKKISQIIKDYCYLPFFLLIILWPFPSITSPPLKEEKKLQVVVCCCRKIPQPLLPGDVLQPGGVLPVCPARGPGASHSQGPLEDYFQPFYIGSRV